MRMVQLPSGRSTTCLGFGCGGLVGGVSTVSSRRLIEAALESGIRHFDVAPSYGLGTAEDVLGGVLRSCRDQVTIATKVGIGRPYAAKLLTLARALSKPILRLAPNIRRAISETVGATKPRHLFEVNSVRLALADSLRRLRTDYLDIYLMHEVNEDDLTAMLVSFMLEQHKNGILCNIGAGTSREVALHLAIQVPQLFEVCQFPWSVLDLPIPRQTNAFIITQGAIRRALNRLLFWFTENTKQAATWSQVLGCDLFDGAVVADLLVAAAITENTNGIVLVSSGRIDRIKRFAKVASDTNLLIAGARLRDIVGRDGPQSNRE